MPQNSPPYLNPAVTGLAGKARLKRCFCWLLSLTIFSATLLGNPAIAQSTIDATDTQPPLIELSPVVEGTAGEIQVFNAEVIDNQDLLAVLFFYRLAGDEQFQSLDMKVLAGTSFYSASVPTSSEDVRNIEYFLQAEDTAGNRSIKGFTFDPLIRKMNAPDFTSAVTDPLANTTAAEPAEETDPDPAQASESADATPEADDSGRKKILWGLVGLAAVVVVAVVLSDDDDGEPADTSGPNPITITPNSGRLLSIRW